MFIVRKDRRAIVNLEQVATLYIGSDGCSIKADYKGGSGCQLGKYHSDKEAEKAIDIVAENIRTGKTEICFMPDDDSVRAKMNLEEQKWHHVTGKKTKGHGGL